MGTAKRHMRNQQSVGFDWDSFADLSSTGQPPANSTTAVEGAERLNISRRTAEDRLKRLVYEGKMDSGMFWNDHLKRSMRFYWMKK